MKRLWHPLNSGGDTIVEVLIVLAIVGLALSISYATANKSLLGVRQSEEHAQALQLVQGQLEQLRGLSAASLASYQTGIPFCIVSAGSAAPASSCGATASNLYNLSITYDSTKSAYTATAKWDDVTGQGTDSVGLSYKFYPAVTP